MNKIPFRAIRKLQQVELVQTITLAEAKHVQMKMHSNVKQKKSMTADIGSNHVHRKYKIQTGWKLPYCKFISDLEVILFFTSSKNDALSKL